MIIDFNNMEEKAFPNFKGGEGDYNARMATHNENKIMKGRLEPGCSIGLHTHDTSCETIFVLSGHAYIIYDDTTEVCRAGECHHCPKGHTHSMINKGNEDLVFYAVVAEQ
ncbi:MAG: cupin domain-containing protein [Lachnospiraceae bacterium]|nr:cupin domain-containing protein [Lachnospiraceae bacterium]